MPLQYNPTESRFLTVAQSRTNNGQKDIRIILDIPTNDFYSLDDDGNFNLIGGGGGSQNLAQVLGIGNSTANSAIMSPNTLTELGITDGQGYLLCQDGATINTYLQIFPTTATITCLNFATNDNTVIQNTTNTINEYVEYNNGVSKNSLEINQGVTKIKHDTNGTQIQEIFVDAASFNAQYNDGINTIYLEGGLTNGVMLGWTDGITYNTFIRSKFNSIELVVDFGGNNFAWQVDDNGFFPKNLPAFQDDAAASGLTAGYMYQTTGTGAAPLDVAGIVMIKQ